MKTVTTVEKFETGDIIRLERCSTPYMVIARPDGYSLMWSDGVEFFTVFYEAETLHKLFDEHKAQYKYHIQLS